MRAGLIKLLAGGESPPLPATSGCLGTQPTNHKHLVKLPRRRTSSVFS